MSRILPADVMVIMSLPRYFWWSRRNCHVMRSPRLSRGCSLSNKHRKA